mgnify:FL=1
MIKKVKDKWLAALQSGKYTHSVGELEEVGTYGEIGTGKCCALGVLMKINGYAPWDHDNMMYDPDDSNTPSQELPSQDLLEKWGMDGKEANDIAMYNDKRDDYNEVIKYIKESL